MSRRALPVLLVLAACGGKVEPARCAGDLVSCEKACAPCERGPCDPTAARACRQVGKLHLRGEVPQFDLVAAAKRYELACERGDPAACAALGLQAQDGRGVPHDPERAVALYGRACEGGAGVGCFNLGGMYYGGNGVAPDVPRARELFARAERLYQAECEGADPSWCPNLGILYEDAFLGPRDPARAANVYRPACETRGDLDSCVNLALLEIDGAGVPADVAKGMARIEQACAKGAPLACGVQGQLLFRGHEAGIARDPQKGLPLLERACTDGEKQACALFAAALTFGDAVPADPVRATALSRRACDLGEAAACRALGEELLPVNPTSALDALERACHIGDGASCVRTGALLQLGSGVPADLPRAGALFRHGCRLASIDSCTAVMLRDEELPLPPELQPRVLQEACSAGLEVACTRLRGR